jgi:hypothetical protein
LLGLHTNLTVVQARLLDILHRQMEDIDKRSMMQQGAQRQWREFSVSLQDSLDLISGNTTNLLTDVFSGLLRLQSLTRESTKFVVQEVHELGDKIRRINNDFDHLGQTGATRIQELGELTQGQISMVNPPLRAKTDSTYNGVALCRRSCPTHQKLSLCKPGTCMLQGFADDRHPP